MLFNSTIFLVFFTIFFAVYWRLKAHLRAQNLLILFGSWFFYGWWDERFLLLIGLSTLVDFLSGIGASGKRASETVRRKGFYWFLGLALIASLVAPAHNWYLIPLATVASLLIYAVSKNLDRLSGPVRRKTWVMFSLTTNLGLLAVFKYFGFFTDAFVDAFSFIGLQTNAPLVQIILPVGISFYTFQTLSYTIDIYRKKMEPTDQFVDFAAYVGFFPQLVAGPIERAQTLLPQFQKTRQWQWDRFYSGLLLFVWGLYKKIVIADNLAPIVDAAFATPGSADPATLTVGILAFTFQIYCDFSGYSDMARGLARMLGFNLMVNFNLPYFSRTPSEFWRRWHISLSTWLRDYLYIPLGGNRRGGLITYRNLILTMLLGGLWHGAAWTFIAWGAFHGFILAAYRFLKVDKLIATFSLTSMQGVLIHTLAWAMMSYLTLTSWVFFRAASLQDALAVLSTVNAGLFSGVTFATITGTQGWERLVFYVSPLIIIQIIQACARQSEILWQGLRGKSQLIRFAAVNLALFIMCSLLFLSAPGGQAFLYFDF